MYCHDCDKKNQNTCDCRAIAKFKHQKKDRFEAKAVPGKKSLAFLFEEINTPKRKLKPEKTANSKKRKDKSIFSIKLWNDIGWRYIPHVHIILDISLRLSSRDNIQRYGKEFSST
jgi:hypothetical protein